VLKGVRCYYSVLEAVEVVLEVVVMEAVVMMEGSLMFGGGTLNAN